MQQSLGLGHRTGIAGFDAVEAIIVVFGEQFVSDSCDLPRFACSLLLLPIVVLQFLQPSTPSKHTHAPPNTSRRDN